MSALKPEQVVVHQDTREQDPLDFAPLRMEPATLRTGDYGLAAAPDACIIERKTASDLLGCIGRERDRFEAELARIRAFPAKVVLIEASWQDMFGDPRSKLTAASITGTIAAWTARYAPFHFAGTRSAAEDFARRFLFNEARRLWAVSNTFTQELTP